MNKITSILTTIILLAILGFATILYIHKIDADNIWHDEARTIAPARLPYAQYPSIFKLDKMQLLATTHITKFVLQFEEYPSEFLLRLPSAIFSVLGVLCIFFLGRFIGGNLCGLVAAVLLTLNLYNLYYAQEIRNYSMAIANISLLLFASLAFLKKNTWGLFLLFIFATVMAPFSFLGNLPVIAPVALLFAIQFFIDAFSKHENKLSWFEKRWGMFVLAAVIVCVVFIPLFAYWDRSRAFNISGFLSKFGISTADKIVLSKKTGGISHAEPFFVFLKSILKQLLGQMPYYSSVTYSNVILQFFAVTGVIGILASLRKHWQLVIWFGVTIFFVFYTRNVRGRVWTRYFIYLLPFCIIFISCGITFLAEIIGYLFDFIYQLFTKKKKNKILIKTVQWLLSASILCCFVYSVTPTIKRYYLDRPNLHAPVKQAVKFMLSNAKSNSFFYGPVRPYGERYSFPFYINLLGKDQQIKSCCFWYDNGYKEPIDKRFVSWFVTMNIDPFEVGIPKTDINYRKFGYIRVVYSRKELDVLTALEYTKKLCDAELKKVNSGGANIIHGAARKWYAKSVRGAIGKLNSSIDINKKIAEKRKYDPSIVFSIRKEDFKFGTYIRPKNDDVGELKTFVNKNDGTVFTFVCKGATDLLAITKAKKFKPGFYVIEAEGRCLASDPKNSSLHLRFGKSGLPRLSWIASSTNWVHKKASFTLEKETKFGIIFGFSRNKPLNISGEIKNVRLIWYPEVNEDIKPIPAKEKIKKTEEKVEYLKD